MRKLITSGNIVFLLIGIAMISVGILFPNATNEDGSSMAGPLIGIGVLFVIFPMILVIARAFYGRRIKKVMEEGKQGKAIVLKLEDTGTRINNGIRVKLLLEMHFENYKPYEVWKKITVSEIRIPQVQPDSTIIVYADPDDPQNTKKLALVLK